MILFIVEGERVEPRFINSLRKIFFQSINSEIEFYQACKKGTIHGIAKQIKEDPDLDVYSLIVEELSEYSNDLKEIRSKVSEIYFFFDYDGHAHDIDDEALKECLSVLSNETGAGKLYLSYPMVESNRDLCSNFLSKKYPIKIGVKYKEFVNFQSDARYMNVNKFNKNDWIEICYQNFLKACYLLDVDSFKEYPCGQIILSYNDDAKSKIEQREIFKKQVSFAANNFGFIYIFGSFPFFLIDYFGYHIFSD